MIRKVEKLEGRADFEQIIAMKDWGGFPCQLLFFSPKKHVEHRAPLPKAKALFLVLNMLQTEHVNTPGEHIQML